jgi:phosphopantothenoylcysteine decarboxylase / phosphopantothenate---cysteine ligase
VRVITNLSSGKMGFALARALADAGARVTLVAGPTELATPFGVERVDAASARAMHDAVMARLADCDLFFGVAAVADYTPAHPQTEKMKKSTATLAIELTPTVDVLKTVAAQANAPFCVGFAAESHNVVQYAREKRIAKKLPLIVANRAQDAMGAADNAVTLIDDAGEHDLPRSPKAVIARQIVLHVARMLGRTSV